MMQAELPQAPAAQCPPPANLSYPLPANRIAPRVSLSHDLLMPRDGIRRFRSVVGFRYQTFGTLGLCTYNLCLVTRASSARPGVVSRSTGCAIWRYVRSLTQPPSVLASARR